MNNNFEKELRDILNEKKEMPTNVRQTLDKTYENIRKQNKKKKRNYGWKNITTVAASASLIAGLALSNDQVKANIMEFFNFNDKGIQKAVNEGFTQSGNSTASDQNVVITLENYFSDHHKIGLSFQLAFEDLSLLDEKVKSVSLAYRMKNGDGEYIAEFVSDTKELYGKNDYVSGPEERNSHMNMEKGAFQYDIVLDSNKGNIPTLNDAVIEVESVIITYEKRGIKIIDGKWTLPLGENTKMISNVAYEMQDKTSKIELLSAIANPTSLNLTFVVDGVIENENTFANRMYILDENGGKYEAKGFGMNVKNNQTIISTNFPISSYEHASKLKLVVEELGETDLIKKQ